MRTYLIVLCLGLTAFVLGCEQEQQGDVLARIDNQPVTLADLEARLEGMPPFMREQLDKPEGRERLLKAIVEEEIIVREAKAMGLDRTEEFRDEMERRQRDALVRLFYERVIDEASKPSQSEIETYYQSHLDQFVEPAKARARHIVVKTEKEARKIKKRLEDGADFAELAKKYSLDALTKDREGVIHGQIIRGKPIKGLGDYPELVDAIFSLKEGEIGGPVETSMGYHVIRLERFEPERQKSLEEVRSTIESQLQFERRQAVRDSVLSDLREKYNVVFLDENVKSETPEELFKKASEESDPNRKILYYKQFTEEFPDDERAYEAHFMIGFTMAEELKDYDGAEKVFKEFLEKYPDTDLTDDAKWMLEHMRSGAEPDFEPE